MGDFDICTALLFLENNNNNHTLLDKITCKNNENITCIINF